MKKLKLFSLAIIALFSLGAMAQTVLWESDFVENISGVTQTKAKSSDTWEDAPSWASPYTKAYKSSSTSSVLTMEFATPFSLQAKDSIHIYWGSTSNRTLTLGANDDTRTQIDAITTSSERSLLREAKYGFEAATTLSKITIGFPGGSNTFIFHIAIIRDLPPCEAPATALTLKCDKTGEILVGDEVTFSTEGGNGADVTISGKNGETMNANKWTAVKGEHTFIASQDVKDGKCGNSVELKLTVISHDPVTAAVISGNKNAVVGQETTLTCTAENASNFQWYKGTEAISGATESEYKFTPDAAGELTFSCEAWNAYTDPHVKSANYTVTVTDAPVICGILIKASRTGTKTATVDAASVVGGTAETNMESDKLDKKCFFGVTLASGTFEEGDLFMMNINKAADVAGSLKLYADKSGSDLICEITENIDGTGDKQWALPAAVAGKSSIYVLRGNVSDWNAFFNTIAVKRSCGNESSDASIKSLTVNGQNATLEGTTYSYELPADFDDEQVTIAWELNDANASADQTSPLQRLFENELTVKIKVTAEDGTVVEYTVHITKAEAPKSNDATIKVLKIENKVIAAVNDTFAYKVPANENLSAVQVEFELNDAKAEADKTSPFIINVPAADAAPNEEKINVTAEDGTKKEYVVSISRGEEQGVENVTDGAKAVKVLRDGQLFIIRNGETYNVIGGRQ